jgi:hypothetical protein
MIDRKANWIGSDLIGVPVTALAVGVALVVVLAFYVGPITLAISLPAAMLGIHLAVRNREPAETDTNDIGRHRSGHHLILVVANRGLDAPALADGISPLAERLGGEIAIIAPVAASSPLRELSDDIDADSSRARARVDSAVGVLRRRGIRVRGHVDDEAGPMTALMDGMREFDASDVVLVTDRGREWVRAEALAERLHHDMGVRVIQIRA